MTENPLQVKRSTWIRPQGPGHDATGPRATAQGTEPESKEEAESEREASRDNGDIALFELKKIKTREYTSPQRRRRHWQENMYAHQPNLKEN